MKKRAFVRYSKNGKIVPGSLILTGGSYPQGPSTWKEVPADLCCDSILHNHSKTFEYSLQGFKDGMGDQLDGCFNYVRSLIPSINLFYDEGNNGMIWDGGDDMYDTGNGLNTNYTQLYDDAKEDNYNSTLNIPYTHTQASTTTDDYSYKPSALTGTINSGTAYFGAGSHYFTEMYPGMFVMAASNLNGVTEFSITGDLGTDANGTNFYYKVPTSYEGWNMYCKTNNDTYQWGDPSVNHLILLKGTGSITQEGDTTGEYDDHALKGMSGITDIILVVFSCIPGSPVVTKEQFRTIGDGILDVAAGTDPCNR